MSQQNIFQQIEEIFKKDGHGGVQSFIRSLPEGEKDKYLRAYGIFQNQEQKLMMGFSRG